MCENSEHNESICSVYIEFVNVLIASTKLLHKQQKNRKIKKKKKAKSGQIGTPMWLNFILELSRLQMSGYRQGD